MGNPPHLRVSRRRHQRHLPDFAYARYAESIGLRGIRVDRPDQVGAAWDAALASDRPCVVEAITDPEAPPLPPHITLEQAKSFMQAILKGDPNRGAFIRQAWREMIEGYVPRRG